DLHRGGGRGRVPGRVVPPADPRQRELRRRAPDAPDVGQPRPPDRAPPLPRPALQPVRADRPEGAGDLRAPRVALQHGVLPEAVRHRGAQGAAPLAAVRLSPPPAGPPRQPGTPASCRARSNTASSISSVSLPVKVFCWLTW